MSLEILIVLTAGLLVAGSPAGDSPGASGDDAAKIQGSWACAAAIVDGKPLDAKVAGELRLTLTATRYLTERGDEVLFDSTYRLDPRPKPRHIEMTGTEGDAAGKLALGIYALDGDTLKICYTMPGTERPTAFESKPGSGAFLVTWTRVGK